MKTIRKLLILGAIILVFRVISPAIGQTTSFVISGADATNTLTTEGSTQLSTLINQTDPRFVLEFADNNKFYTLETIPGALGTLYQRSMLALSLNSQMQIYLFH